MLRSRPLLMLVGSAAIIHGCVFLSDFSHLDDGQAVVATTAGGGGEAGQAGSGGAMQSGGGDGGDGGAAGDGGTCAQAVEPCDSAAECCGDLSCETTASSPSQEICCGEATAACSFANGEDCCGQLLCKPTVSSGGVFVCCGGAGHPCATVDGSDCCEALDCISGQCT